MAGAAAEDKIRRYEEFLNEKLRADLQTATEARERIADDVREYEALAETVRQMQATVDLAAPLTTQVDLGCSFFCRAVM